MTTTEIKKALYKQKPTARFLRIKNSIARYVAKIDEGEYLEREVFFSVPIDDMGDISFENEMDGKLMIRWMVESETID